MNRYDSKIRGIARQLRAVDRWADSFETIIPPFDPDSVWTSQYWNSKLPVDIRLVNPPWTRPNIQRQVLASMMKALQNLARSPLQYEVPYFRAAALIEFPYLFWSEVTAFYDEDYYRSFFQSDGLVPDERRPSQMFDLTLPPGCHELGSRIDLEDEAPYDLWLIGPEP